MVSRLEEGSVSRLKALGEPDIRRIDLRAPQFRPYYTMVIIPPNASSGAIRTYVGWILPTESKVGVQVVPHDP